LRISHSSPPNEKNEPAIKGKSINKKDNGEIKPVIVHAILDQKGKVLDAEVVQTSDPTLSGAALGVVWHPFLSARDARGPPPAARSVHQLEVHAVAMMP
jgi:hypothetical protein